MVIYLNLKLKNYLNVLKIKLNALNFIYNYS